MTLKIISLFLVIEHTIFKIILSICDSALLLHHFEGIAWESRLARSHCWKAVGTRIGTAFPLL